MLEKCKIMEEVKEVNKRKAHHEAFNLLFYEK